MHHFRSSTGLQQQFTKNEHREVTHHSTEDILSSSHCGQLCFLLNITESWANNNKSSYAVGNDLKTEFKYKSKNIFINETPDLSLFCQQDKSSKVFPLPNCSKLYMYITYLHRTQV